MIWEVGIDKGDCFLMVMVFDFHGYFSFRLAIGLGCWFGCFVFLNLELDQSTHWKGQWIFQILVKGGLGSICRLAVYTAKKIAGIYCLLEGSKIPTT